MTVIYIDSVFVLNALMDYLLLLAAARLAGLPLRRGRYLLGALFGGAYAAAVFLPGLGFLAAMPVKLAAGVLLGLIAYGGEEKLLRLLLLFFGVSCGMAGCVLGLGLLSGSGVPVVSGVFYTNVDAKVLLIAAASAYAVLSVVFRASARQAAAGLLLPVKVCLFGRAAEFTALWDSGNGLRDGNGQAVLVVAPGYLDPLFPPEARPLLTPEALRKPEVLLEPLRRLAPELRPRLTPYQSVGGGGLLLAVRTDWAEINGTRWPGLTAALSPAALGTAGALWGGGLGKEGQHGHREKAMEKDGGTAGKSGASAGGERSLHRGERYSAAASDTGAGSRIAGSYRRSRPTGID